MNEKMKRILMSVIGLLVTALSIALLRKAALGTDPFTCFAIGVGNLAHASYGTVYPFIIGVLLVVVFFLNKHYIGIATVINLFLVGPAVDLSFNFLNRLYEADSLLKMGLTFVLAVVVLCFGMSLYITADQGVSSYDALALIMADKKIATYRICRIATDILCVVFGFLFKAEVGIGTVITAFGLGPLTQWFIEHVAEKILYGKNGRMKQ